MMTFTTCSLLTLHLNHYIHYILELGLVFSRSETFVFIVGVAMGVFFPNMEYLQETLETVSTDPHFTNTGFSGNTQP